MTLYYNKEGTKFLVGPNQSKGQIPPLPPPLELYDRSHLPLNDHRLENGTLVLYWPVLDSIKVVTGSQSVHGLTV